MSLFKVSLPGVNVDAANPFQTVVDSDYANPKINKKATPPHRGLVQLTLNNTYLAGTNTAVYTLKHGYAYTPEVWGVVSDNTGNNIFGFMPYISGFHSVTISTDATNMYITVVAGATDWTPNTLLNISYAIFADNGAKNV